MAVTTSPRRGARRARSPWIRRSKQAAALLSIVFLVGLAGGLVVWIPIYRESVDDAQNLEKELVVRDSNPSIIYSADGVVLYRVSRVRRKVVDLNDLPKYVRYAIVAAEDRRFYDHRGVDVMGLLRAATNLAREGHYSGGGSTIDMQLAKRLVNGSDVSMSRKLKDIATAQQIENLRTKDEILNLYANEVYYGEGAHGIQAAAETYFNKDAKDLTIGEAAMLARCVRTPSRDNPIKDLRKSLVQRDYVLDVMREEGWITDAEWREAKAEVPKINPNPPTGVMYRNPYAAYFVDHVKQQFEADNPGADLATGGYKIYTTLNYKLQKAATDAVQETVRENRDQKVNDAALVVIDQTGKIRAEVGGPSYRKSQFNNVTQGRMQPGSGFKPILYATALRDNVVHPGDRLDNSPIALPQDGGTVWRPRNAGRERVGGTFSLEEAMAQSVNLPAIHTILKVGPLTVASAGKHIFGIQSRLEPYGSLALGTSPVSPLELAEAYSVFMLRGDRVHPYPITKVIGPDGEVVRDYEPNRMRNVLSPQICEEMDSLLEGVVDHGTGTAAKVVPDARGKTGTTNSAKDAWFNGYSDGLLGITWVGNSRMIGGVPHQLPMRNSVYGGTVSAGMWAKVMLAAHKLNLTQNVVFAKPPQDEVAPPPKPVAEDVPAIREPVEEAKPEDTPPTDDAPPATPAPEDTPPVISAPAAKTPDPDPASTPIDVPPATAPPPRRTPPPKAKDADTDTVEVEICADTGLRASMYCPETVTRTFPKGKEPKRVCRLHTGG